MINRLILFVTCLFPMLCLAQACPDLTRLPEDELFEEWQQRYLMQDPCVDSVWGNNDGEVSPSDYSAFIEWARNNWQGPFEDLPDWYPSSEPVRVSTERELANAIEDLHEVGGIIEVTTQQASDALALFLGQDISGDPNNWIVFRAAGEGSVIRLPVRNITKQLQYLALDGFTHRPDNHGGKALKLFGEHHDLVFMNTVFEDWTQVYEIKYADDPELLPYNISFVDFRMTGIYNANAPVQTADNQNDKNNRAQGGAFQGRNFRFIRGQHEGIGWNVLGDPERTRVSKFDQIHYVLQRSEGVVFQDCVFVGAANAAIQCKGRGLVVQRCTFDLMTVAITLGTNESEQFPATALIEDCTILDMIPLNHLDDPTLPNSERIRANSGVGISFNNASGVVIRNVTMQPASGTRKVFAWFSTDNKPANARLSMDDILIDGCDISTNDMAQVRDHWQPDTGMYVKFVDISGSGSRSVVVRNTTPTDRSVIVENMTLDGFAVETR